MVLNQRKGSGFPIRGAVPNRRVRPAAARDGMSYSDRNGSDEDRVATASPPAPPLASWAKSCQAQPQRPRKTRPATVCSVLPLALLASAGRTAVGAEIANWGAGVAAGAAGALGA